MYGYRFTPEEAKLLKDAFTLGSIVLIGFFVLCLIFNIWFFCIVKSCFRFLEDFHQESRAAMRYGIDMGNGNGGGSGGASGAHQLLLQPATQNHVPHPPPPPAVAPPPYPPYNHYPNSTPAVKSYGYPAYSYGNSGFGIYSSFQGFEAKG